MIHGGTSFPAFGNCFNDFANDFDSNCADALNDLVNFANDVMTGVGAQGFLQRIESLQAGTARKSPSEAEQAALDFVDDPAPRTAALLLERIGQQSGVRPHRPEVLRACFETLRTCAGAGGVTFAEAAIAAREHGRLTGRALPQRAVGSALLLKGLEADMAVVLNADQLDSKNLYVAMTRGARRLVICSRADYLSGPECPFRKRRRTWHWNKGYIRPQEWLQDFGLGVS